MTAFIRRYAGALTLLSVLGAAIAAPYMIPENPDSAVMRSGTLGLILLCACAYPVRQALERASLRTLICGLFWGLAFSFALSLGSELFVYDGLLPGMGSLVRRLAVPVMAAPMTGLLCARLLMLRIPQGKPLRIPIWGYMLILLICWTPVLLAYFPGMLNYDFLGEYEQHASGLFTNLHPLLHSALVDVVFSAAEAIHSPTLGLLLMTLLQMILFALSLSFGLVFLQRRGAPAWALALLTALFALHPIFSVMALSMTKDTLFAAALLALTLMTFELIESPDAFWKSRRRIALYICLAAVSALMRSNGVAALVLLLPGVIVCLKGMRRRAVMLCAGCAGAAALLLGLLTLVYAPQKMPSFQLYSLPAQQLVRAYHSGTLSDEQRSELEGWYTSPEGLVVHPHLADAAKGYLDRSRLETEGDSFMALWKRGGKTGAHAYLEAFLMLNVGSWYPDDLSHSTIYPDVSWNDKGYLQTQEFDMTAYGIRTSCLLPSVRSAYEKFCRRNEYQSLPLVSILFAPSTPFWALIFACAALLARGRGKPAVAVLGLLGVWLSYLFGPCTLPRYALPLFAAAPVLLCAALLASPLKEE